MVGTSARLRIWYLYYKLLVEDDLRQYRGLGIGGSTVISPFAAGLFFGTFGEFAYGSLEGGPFDNAFSTAFYCAFAWIYLQLGRKRFTSTLTWP